ncbi:MAG: ankyrin repeat domain-containing protein [Planctomycetota bacterium]
MSYTIIKSSVVILLAILGMGSLNGEKQSVDNAVAEHPNQRNIRAGTTFHLEFRQQLENLNGHWRHLDPNLDVLDEQPILRDEVSMIQSHLRLVIEQLESAKIDHLSNPQIANRESHIRALRHYMQIGRFPQNTYAAGRHPVFIDQEGTHCAVGHLIALSGNAELAQRINRQHQLDFLRDIRTSGLAQWQVASGLSLDELALIQPTYISKTLSYPREIQDLIRGDSSSLLEALRKGNRSVHDRCGGKTILHFAAISGNLKLAKYLVEHGANINAVTELGCDKTELTKGGNRAMFTVRWNEPTRVNNDGPRGIGVRGEVFRTKRGRLIADALGDLRGGFEGVSAYELATRRLQSRYALNSRPIFRPGSKSGKPIPAPVDNELDQLEKGRQAVAEYLLSLDELVNDQDDAE